MWDDSRLIVQTITDWVDAHLAEPTASSQTSVAATLSSSG
jgi:hypothetical protein